MFRIFCWIRIESELDFVCSFYKDDLCKQQIQAQIPLLMSFLNMCDDMELYILNLVQLLLKMLDTSAITT